VRISSFVTLPIMTDILFHSPSLDVSFPPSLDGRGPGGGWPMHFPLPRWEPAFIFLLPSWEPPFSISPSLVVDPAVCAGMGASLLLSPLPSREGVRGRVPHILFPPLLSPFLFNNPRTASNPPYKNRTFVKPFTCNNLVKRSASGPGRPTRTTVVKA